MNGTTESEQLPHNLKNCDPSDRANYNLPPQRPAIFAALPAASGDYEKTLFAETFCASDVASSAARTSETTGPAAEDDLLHLIGLLSADSLKTVVYLRPFGRIYK